MSTTGAAETTRAAVFIERVTIRNFKGITQLEVELQPDLSLLVGRNNAGKSRILRALHVAVGGVPVERDDLTVGSSDPAEIDVVVAPRLAQSAPGAASLGSDEDDPEASVGGDEDDSEALDQKFEAPLQGLFGAALALVSDSPVRQRFAWRTTIMPAGEGSGARYQSQTMAFSSSDNEWHATGLPLAREARNLVYAELVDTRRDLDAELRQRGTAIRRILNDLQVQDADREALEQRLEALGDDILMHSDTLQGLRDSLDSLDRYVDSLGAARVDPVPRTLEELARAVGVSFLDGSDPLASRLHGSGVRSLASLLVQDVFYRQALGVDGGTIRPHAITLIEEPEAHLHPHAVFELAELLKEGGRQVVATTHSPLLAASVAPEALLLVRRSPDGDQSILGFGPVERDEDDERRTRKPGFYASEMEKLTRQAERPFGDLLFASAIVIGDGATERAFLPPVLREAMGPLAHGISVIDSGGMNDPIVRAVIKFARHVEVPLVVFADADRAGRERVGSLVAEGLLDESLEVVWAHYPGAERPHQRREPSVAVERMMIEAASDMCVAACETLGEAPESEADVLAAMKRNKGSIGATLAREFIATFPSSEAERWPEPLLRLASVLSERLAPRPSNPEAST